MTTYRIGIDVGFGDTKLAYYEDGQLNTLSFPSVIGNAERNSTMRVGLGGRKKRRQYIEYEGQELFVGDDAIELSRLAASRQDANRIGSPDERVLMLTALVRAGLFDVQIVTGLPVLWWDERRHLVKSWNGTHEIRANGTRYQIHVREIRPVWQPLGSFYARYLNDAGIAILDEAGMLSGFGIVDIGMNTTDLSGLENLVPAERWSTGIRIGVRDALGIISDDIEATYRVHRSVHEIAYALRTSGEIRIYQDAYTLDGNAQSALDSLAQQIVSEATNRWEADRFHTVLITGGGAALIGKAVKAAFPVNAEILDQPALANAIGFARYAQRNVFKD